MKIKPGFPVTQILAILWATTEDEVKRMRFDVHAGMQNLAFLDSPVPQTVKANPISIELLSIAAFEDFKVEAGKLKGEAKDLELYPILYATYLTDSYDSEVAERGKTIVENLPCGQVIGTVHYYLEQVREIEERWGAQFPKTDYTSEQISAGYQNIDKTFKFFGTLFYMQENTKFTRDQLLKMTVAEFKYNLLYLAWRSDAAKKYNELQAMKAPRGRR